MCHVTFKRIASDESRIYDAGGDHVGDVYAQDDILNPGSRVYVVHLSEGRGVSFVCTIAPASARSPRNGFSVTPSLPDTVMVHTVIVRTDAVGRVAARWRLQGDGRLSVPSFATAVRTEAHKGPCQDQPILLPL